MSNRRNFLKKTALGATALSTTSSFGFNILKKTVLEDQIIGHGDFKYKVVKDWAQMSVAHNPILNCHEMQMDSKGRLIMLGDHTDNNILVFDKSGKLLDYWGTRYPGGHGLTLHDEGGEDMLYIVDCGWFVDRSGKWSKQAGTVSKTTVDGRLLFTLPDPHTIGAYTQEQEYLPTETAVGPNGDIYVADGYGSDFILQFNHKGEFIRKWGGHDNKDKNYNLHNAHGVAVDYRNKKNPVLVVTSRSDKSFKFFTLDGKFIKTVELPGAYVCRPVLDDDNIYAGVCWSENKTGKRFSNSGFVTIMDGENKVVSNPGGDAPQYKNGKLQQMYQSEKAVFNHGHDVFVDEDKNLYVCQWNANRTPPIKLERV
ncbi:6-bladed beta-propeller [Zobellia galactanivorans]|uniref:Beta-propeller fold protein n=1 Tax=Zobellia galactanivorans (strain DSM 12802 / CCUG 47099 / CIP 106680 / NCIMB 13871 / Dsij) TaxID=63186 RepID=G0L718_ZOBGA|nr:peptidylglycine monooxygenase [Zobellia galactanivorans]MBU3025632.1 6-bladed beta-propeller [Zobellia galactanivorans]MDO6808061.1 6-bladed beta-propeller [Zobellia galactanivorans]CAZ98823.1 Beta-propeller fold protein [Zobellia galactanivorans]